MPERCLLIYCAIYVAPGAIQQEEGLGAQQVVPRYGVDTNYKIHAL